MLRESLIGDICCKLIQKRHAIQNHKMQFILTNEETVLVMT